MKMKKEKLFNDEIFDGAYCVLIWNRETKLIKIKPKN
jgi:hypothetical protein